MTSRQAQNLFHLDTEYGEVDQGVEAEVGVILVIVEDIM